MSDIDLLNAKAAGDGIDTYDAVRDGVIALRNQLLTRGTFDAAVLLSHLIWWLSVLKEQIDD